MQQDVRPCISGWLKNSFIDFPGTVSTVLFFQGCNLRCPFCHNAALVTGAPTPVDHEEIFEFLKRRRGLIDGVVLSGGEPTIHGEDLVTFTERIRSTGVKIKLDTNGLLPGMIPRVNPDYLAVDLKTLPDRYGELGWKGGDPSEMLATSLDIVRSMGNNAEVRITAASPFIDDAAIEAFLPLLDGIEKVFLQPFVDKGSCIDASTVFPVDGETLERYRERIAGVVKVCVVRGV